MPEEYELKLVPLKQLKPHEKLIPELLRELEEEIKRDGYLRNPLIVDGKTGVVLDGNHRLEVLKRLGCAYVPACLVNYDSDSIKLDRWYPVLLGPGGMEELLEVLRKAGYKVVYTTREGAEEMVNRGEAVAAILPPLVTKEEVRRRGRLGDPLPPKTTRHVIPNRPLNLNVPLSLLMDDGKTLEEKNRVFLEKCVKGRRVRRYESVVVYE